LLNEVIFLLTPCVLVNYFAERPIVTAARCLASLQIAGRREHPASWRVLTSLRQLSTVKKTPAWAGVDHRTE